MQDKQWVRHHPFANDTILGWPGVCHIRSGTFRLLSWNWIHSFQLEVVNISEGANLFQWLHHWTSSLLFAEVPPPPSSVFEGHRSLIYKGMASPVGPKIFLPSFFSMTPRHFERTQRRFELDWSLPC